MLKLSRLLRIKNLLPANHTLVFHVTSRVVLVMTATFTVTNFILVRAASDRIKDRIYADLVSSNNFLSYGVHQWSLNLKKSLRTLTLNDEVRGLTPDANRALAAYSSVYPLRQFRIWNRDGKLIATTQKNIHSKVLVAAEKKIKSRPYFKQALYLGQSSYQMVFSNLNGKACLSVAEPIYAPGVPLSGFKTATPVGVASFCLPLTSIGSDSSLSALEDDITNSPSMLNTNRLDLLQRDTTGRAFLLLSNDGNLILPFDKKQEVELLTPRRIINGPYGPFVNFANKSSMAPGKQIFGRIMIGNKHYFVLVKQADSQWKTIEIFDEHTAFTPLRKSILLLISLQIFTVLIIALSITLACRNTLSPLKDVVTAIDKISSGDFNVNIQTMRKGEIASLFNSVNQTAIHLKLLLADKLASALNQSQMDTAQSIQKCFLVQDLPQTSYSQVAASFKPAYEIGADWYDAIEIEGVLYTVVADVCDKGVPSALFMSVFRSLLRYTLIKNALGDETENVTDLANVMTLVNDYMSSTHGISAMFATVFVSAYDPSKNTLSYVTCGHELPFILRASGQLDILEVCGPAIGIFEGANFIIKDTPFGKGDILFSYTDGLVDARSPEGKSFGYEATKAILVGLSEAQKIPQVIVDLVNNIVNDHMDGADQFDDLTILALKAI